MVSKHSLGIVDYVVVGASLLISALIGVWFRKGGTSDEFLMAGKDMPKLPVILSITVTMFGSVAVLALPGEVYRYGFYPILMMVTVFAGTVFAAYVFVPVYFKCKISTVYEFLEMRYGTKLRYVVSTLFLIQMIFFMSLNLYGPVLAMGAVTDLSTDMSIILIGVVCTFYCMLGGLKAVLWTDAFQALLIFAFMILLFCQSIVEAGGFGRIFVTANEGDRLVFWNVSLDMTLRYTFWSTCARGLVGGLAYYGTSQIEIQRMLSMRNFKRARSSLLWSTIPTTFIGIVSGLIGLVMYGIFHSCDPVQDVDNTGLEKYDQMIPYYIVTRFSSFPGVTGLCVAGVFSGTLSTLSSALNSVSTVTVLDFLKPLFPSSRFVEKRTVLIAKFLSIFYGAICIGLTFAIAKAESIIVTGNILMSVMEGPIVAVFLIAVLTRKGSERSVLFGLLLGIITTCWIGYGSLFSGFVNPPLPLSTSECPSSLNSTYHCNDTCVTTTLPEMEPQGEPFLLYKISFMWISALGCVVSLIFTFLIILITGWKNVIPADSKCLSPITRLWNNQKALEPSECKLSEAISLEEKGN